MRPQYKNEDLLKIHPFYNEEIKIEEKKKRNAKICTKISNNYQKHYHFTHFKNRLPFFEDAGISRRERAFKGYAETCNVEVRDNKRLDDSLYLAKSSIKRFLNDLLEEKQGMYVY